MPWIILLLAGVFEIGWAIGLKYTEGFTRPWPTLGTVAAMAISLGLLGVAMKSLPVGTAYAVWVGLGLLLTVVFEATVMGQGGSALRWVFVGMLLVAVVGLKLTAPH